MSIAKEIFLTKGTGKHREQLPSFEMALRDAGIAAFNIVRVSSIFPPYCKLISKIKGLKKLQQGQIVFAVMSEAATDEANRLVAAAVGVAMPRDPSLYGYLSEHHSHGQTERVAGDYSEDLAAEMLATTLGVDFRSRSRLGCQEGTLENFRSNRQNNQHHSIRYREEKWIVDNRCGRSHPDYRLRV